MRLLVLLLAAAACAHRSGAASVRGKFDLDNVDLDDEQANAVSPDLKTIEVIPVKVIDENSNDYIPPDDLDVNVKRVEVDLDNPGPPQRQEHETQTPGVNYSENDKIVVAIKNTIAQAQSVFNEGLKSVSDSFKTFTQADEDLPLIQQNIKNLKETFTGQIEKLNDTIRSYFKPDDGAGGGSSDRKFEIFQARLKFLENNFRLGVDTLAEGVEVYSIIKEEDEAERATALKANVKADPVDAPNDPVGASEPVKPAENPEKPAGVAPQQPAGPIFPWTAFMTNFANSMQSAWNNLLPAAVSGGANTANDQKPEAQPSNPLAAFFQGISIPNFLPGQNTAVQPAQQPSDPAKPEAPANTQADPVAAPAQPAQWNPLQGMIQTVQNSWNQIINPGQNAQQQQTPQPPPANPNPVQQAIQSIVSVFNPQTPQGQQPANPPNAAPVAAATPDKVPQSANKPDKEPQSSNKPDKVPQSADKPEEAPIQGSNVVPAPVNDQPQTQALPNQVNPPAQAGPIQQLVQNNPIIKGIQNAVQRIQGTPNPETPREEIAEEDKKKEVVAVIEESHEKTEVQPEVDDPKGHHWGDHPNKG